MNLLSSSLSALLDAARRSLGLGRKVTLRYQASEGRSWTTFEATRLTRRVDLDAPAAGFTLRQAFVSEARFVGDEVHITTEVTGPAEVAPKGEPSPSDQMRMRVMAAMPTPTSVMRLGRDGSYRGAESVGMVEGIKAAALAEASPEIRAHVEAAIDQQLDDASFERMVREQWFRSVGFFLGEPTLELGATYEVELHRQLPDGTMMRVPAQFGAEDAADPGVVLWMEEHQELEALARVTRMQVEALTPQGAPLIVPEPTLHVERRREHVDPDTLAMSWSHQEKVARSRVAGHGEVEVIDRKETRVTDEPPT